MTTFNPGQITFIILVFVLLVLSIALILCTKYGNKSKVPHHHHNNNNDNDVYGFYQKKVSFQLDDNLDDSNHLVLPTMNEMKPEAQQLESKQLEPNQLEIKQLEPKKQNEIIDYDITSAFVNIN